MNIVFVGNVDAGKSTLCGDILLPSIDQQTINAAKDFAIKNGKESFWKAFILDVDDFEREKCITVNYARYETPFGYNIIDCPGHENFIQHMIQGSSMANIGIIVVSSKNNEYERSLKGQTTEHALLLYTLGLSKVIVAVNKMDSITSSTNLTEAWNKERYEYIVGDMSKILKNIGFKVKKDVSFIPVSAYHSIGIHDKNPLTNVSLNEVIAKVSSEVSVTVSEDLIVTSVDNNTKKFTCIGTYDKDLVYLLNTPNNCSKITIKEEASDETFTEVSVKTSRFETSASVKVYDILSKNNVLYNIFLLDCYIFNLIVTKGLISNIHIGGICSSFEVLDLYERPSGPINHKSLKKKTFAKGSQKVILKIKTFDSIPVSSSSSRIIIRNGNKTDVIGSIIFKKLTSSL
jgi:translation elongation factor EF-G